MGPKRIQSLFTVFQDIDSIAKADTDIIAKNAKIPLNRPKVCAWPLDNFERKRRLSKPLRLSVK